MKYTTALITLATITTATAQQGRPPVGGTLPEIPVTTTASIAARQAEVTVSADIGGGVRKADHDGDDDDNDLADFKSGVDSFVSKATSGVDSAFSKATSAVGGAFQGTPTPDPSKNGDKGSGAGLMSPGDGGLGYLLTGVAALVGAGAYLL